MSKFRILVVDDEQDLRQIERMALGEQYEIVEAHDGLDALEKLEWVEPDPSRYDDGERLAERAHAKLVSLPQ